MIPSARNIEKGFTLIELVLIIVIASVLAIVATVAFRDLDSGKLADLTRKLTSDIRYAQQLSMTTQIIHGVTILAGSYTVFENDNPADPARNPEGGQNFVIDLSSGPYSGVTLATTLPGGLVKFTAAGEPLDGAGTAVAGGTNTITVSYPGVPDRTITIEPNTGKVTY